MSIPSEITRLQTNVTNALQAIAAKGVTVPEGATSDDMADLINQITVGETGTWTPVLDGLATTNVAVGNYTKIGSVVIIDFFVTGVMANWTSVDTNGFMCITGIPFEAATGRNWYGGGGHWQGGQSIDESAYFDGYVLQPSNQRIYPRTSKIPQDTLQIGGGYVKPIEGQTIYCAGTIMYKAAS